MTAPGAVVDASALIAAVTGRTASAGELRRRLVATTTHAPHLVDAEAGNVLRRMVLRGDLEVEEAAVHLERAPGLVDHRYPHRGRLALDAWSLRENLTFYDALYVSLAKSLRVVLLTADGRLAGAPGLPCRVEVVP